MCRSKDRRCCCAAVDTLADLRAIDLANFDAVVCATRLRDAAGLDALAYLQDARPDLPVILIGSDESLAVEAIRSGALDFIVTSTPDDLHALPLAVENA